MKIIKYISSLAIFLFALWIVGQCGILGLAFAPFGFVLGAALSMWCDDDPTGAAGNGPGI